MHSDANAIRIVPYEVSYRDQVLALGRLMHAESQAHADIALDEAKLMAQIEEAAANPACYLALAVREGEVLGGFLGMITTVYFSQQLAAKDLAWFVKPNRRGSYAALLLVAAFEEWAMARGIKKFFLGQSTGIEIETTTKLYEHLGYRVVGVNTVKDVS